MRVSNIHAKQLPLLSIVMGNRTAELQAIRQSCLASYTGGGQMVVEVSCFVIRRILRIAVHPEGAPSCLIIG